MAIQMGIMNSYGSISSKGAKLVDGNAIRLEIYNHLHL